MPSALHAAISPPCVHSQLIEGMVERKAGIHAPRWEHTVNWTHNCERKQISWPWHAREKGGVGRNKERSPPQFLIIPSYSAGWLTSFPSKAGSEGGNWGSAETEAEEGRERQL